MSDTEGEFPPTLLAYAGLRAALELHIIALEAAVKELGEIKGSTKTKVSRAGAKHDFLFYCFTRCCRTNRAITLLLDSLLPEEAYPLTRTVYEHYVAVACVLS